jgi:1,4-dihydroxy-2-naphthoate octaprenyltransferase
VASRKQQRLDPNRVARSTEDKMKNASRASKRPGGQPKGVPKVRKATAGDWIGGARLRTLSLAVAPVVLGTAAAHTELGPWHWVRALLALVVAVALQIGVNYANDYSDGIRGTDKYRVGPSRLTGSGAAKPQTVLAVAMAFFAIAAIAGVIIVVRTEDWWLLAVGAVSIVAAYFYTGGKRPYGYYGLGELVVFVFFGLVATAGTTYIQLGTVNTESWLAAVCAGLFACAVLMVNNLRDRDQDKIAGKRTLSVLVGDLASRILFVLFVLLPFVVLIYFILLYVNAYFTLFLLLIALPVSAIVMTATTPKELILALKLTSLMALLFSILLGWALVF